MSYRPELEGCFVVYKDEEMWAICGQEHQALQTRSALEYTQPSFTWTSRKIESNIENLS
jgi:hypothetical protein